MTKYLSGRVKRVPQSQLTDDRYQSLALNQAEPNLGDPSLYTQTLPIGVQQQLVSVIGYPGQRYWISVGGGSSIGGITVYDENIIVPTNAGVGSITQLNFVGAAISAKGYLNLDGSPGIGVTIKVSPPGNNGEVLFKELDDFATSTKLVFNSSVGILTIGNGLNVGSGGTIFTIKPTGLIGIGTINPTQELHIQGDLRLTGTVYDYNNQPGDPNNLLVKNNFGGLTWVNQNSIRAGAGGTYQNVQYHNSVGLVDGAATFVFDEVNNRVGIGSTYPKVTFDVLGISSFTGNTTIDNLKVGVATIGTLGVTGLTTTKDLNVTGIATIGNIKIGINTVSTTTGNLILDSSTGTTQINDALYINDATQSTTKDTGSIIAEGGVGIEGNLNVGGAVSFTGSPNGVTITLASAGGITTTGGDLYVGGDLYTKGDLNLDEIFARYGKFTENLIVLGSVGIGTTNPLDKLDVRGAITGVTNIKASDNVTNITLTSGTLTTFAGDIKVGGNDIQASTGATSITLSGENVTVVGDIKVGGNDIQASTGATSITLSGENVTVVGTLTVIGNDIKSSTATALTLSDANVTAKGNLTVEGNTILGVGVGDTISFGATVSSHIIPSANNVYDLGSTTQKWNTVYATTFNGQFNGNADTATRLQTPREIDIDGDVIGVGIGTTFDGSQNVVIQTGLSTTGVTAGTYGSATQVGIVTVDAKGRITSASNVNINFGAATVAEADTVKTVSSAAAVLYPTFVDSNNSPGAYESLYTDDGISYNATTDLLTVGKIKPTQIQDSSSGTGTENHVLTANGSGGWTWKVASTAAGNAAISGIIIKEENAIVGSGITSIAFVGDGVTATAIGNDATITFQQQVGPQGTAGAQGAQGTAGAQGAQGTAGAQGAQGTAGAQGAQGTAGAQGAQGTAGAQGAQGTAGAQGAQGTAGAQGAQGTAGAQGAQGTAGAQGAQGTAGAQGAQGTAGAQGAQGTAGAQGAQGTAGAQGATGPVTGSEICRAFVNFNGNDGTINHSFNISSVTYNGLGDYSINFSNTASTSNFASAINASGEGEFGRSFNKTMGFLSSTTTQLRLNTRASGPNGGLGETYGIDYLNVGVCVFYN